jgi:hypothetical protein
MIKIPLPHGAIHCSGSALLECRNKLKGSLLGISQRARDVDHNVRN